ncbi:hypothetical protein GWE18_00510 [Bradyrhizobium sp. CSA112]|uniref:hypothetical protein n=1 Tax=Bradyrhizobium sp. CSA112 TaxID=2699170 RepID=UPI0023B0A263|nr:hypothetical protein [Bradyrhizobium sp. CSA112]MDE5451358.1 hypothetical protein [Bradyrhizobium sp. CSA112]
MTKEPTKWRIIQVPTYPRGLYGIETNDPDSVKNNEAILVYPCMTKANAELIVEAHNRAANGERK